MLPSIMPILKRLPRAGFQSYFKCTVVVEFPCMLCPNAVHAVAELAARLPPAIASAHATGYHWHSVGTSDDTAITNALTART